jgi:hypothetical protein
MVKDPSLNKRYPKRQKEDCDAGSWKEEIPIYDKGAASCKG